MSRSKNGRRDFTTRLQSAPSVPAVQNQVTSLLDAMQDGQEYGSIVSITVPPSLNLIDEVVKGLKDIEGVRGRPCLIYAGNVISADGTDCGVLSSDDVPFQEMVASVPAEHREVDVFLATNGGSGEQISLFVNCLRSRFDRVDFLIPSSCMSAGTLFALSGDRIYMTPNARLGPIDPQVPSAGGRFVPAQALLLLVDQLQKDGAEAMKNGMPVPWSAVRIIDSLDKKELAAAITASQWSQSLATEYLVKYKLKSWSHRESTGLEVTDDYRRQRANEIGAALVSHQRWKNHGHAISRDVLWNEIRLKIDVPDAALERSMIRLWALLTWIFDKSPARKLICSSSYRFARNQVHQIIREAS